MAIEPLRRGLIDSLVAAALAEDHAFDDATTLATVAPGLQGNVQFLAREGGVVAGLAFAEAAFRHIDPAVRFVVHTPDGARFDRGVTLASAEGPVRALLQGERVALNFLQRLSGTATLTRRFVDAVDGTRAVILDTRKTTPGLREAEKYAVRCGGGTNHRPDLASMAMIKDNHREALAREGLTLVQGASAIRERSPGIPVEIEIDSLDDLEAALAAKPEWVLLDNMPIAAMAEAVRKTAGRAKLEASGGVSIDTVREIAETGVDAISVGALTHSARALDISLDLSFAD
ncbi:MAG: carboxylating nicotinate-nucleotide diphosphorylase [Dehalococcoidia bacterium]|nr:carboxylating nicotinate-nucleotide diphosphorylase [Dehalococcoidia bacterium]